MGYFEHFKLDVYVNWNTGISNLNENNFEIFPNPNNGQFTIQFKKNTEPFRISLVNSIGVLVFDKDLNFSGNQKGLNMNLKELESGLYFIEIETNAKRLFEKVIIY